MTVPDADHGLVEALFEDRDRIGRDLHDLVIQRLFAIGLSLDSTARQAPPEIADKLARAIDDIDTTIKDIRHTIFELSSPRAGLDLRHQLVRVVEEAAATLGFRPKLSISGPLVSVADAALAAHVVAVIREALSNAARHAAATSIEVDVRAGDGITVRVVDDGRGIPPDLVTMGGLQNLRERAEGLGGTFDVASSEGRTTLTWHSPGATVEA